MKLMNEQEAYDFSRYDLDFPAFFPVFSRSTQIPGFSRLSRFDGHPVGGIGAIWAT